MADERMTLQSSRYFSGFDEEVIDRFVACAEHKNLNAGEILFVEQAEEDDIYLLLEGEIKLEVKIADEEHPKEIITLKPGDLPGVQAFIAPGPRFTTATAISNVSLLNWKYDDWETICNDYPNVGFYLCREIAKDIMTALRFERNDLLDHLQWGL